MFDARNSPERGAESPATPARHWFARAPAMMAFAKLPGRKRNGRSNWLLNEGELRYGLACGAHANKDGLVQTSQRKLAEKLGVSRSATSRWERGLIRKGFAESARVASKGGRFPYRVLRLLYPSWPTDAQNDSVSA